ncbi:hypothetical protein J6590_077521 [Homalodisca vitripennis]|nr:hypothetical protein J6590_077521 [Homalodisca vitripennis]
MDTTPVFHLTTTTLNVMAAGSNDGLTKEKNTTLKNEGVTQCKVILGYKSKWPLKSVQLALAGIFYVLLHDADRNQQFAFNSRATNSSVNASLKQSRCTSVSQCFMVVECHFGEQNTTKGSSRSSKALRKCFMVVECHFGEQNTTKGSSRSSQALRKCFMVVECHFGEQNTTKGSSHSSQALRKCFMVVECHFGEQNTTKGSSRSSQALRKCFMVVECHFGEQVTTKGSSRSSQALRNVLWSWNVTLESRPPRKEAVTVLLDQTAVTNILIVLCHVSLLTALVLSVDTGRPQKRLFQARGRAPPRRAFRQKYLIPSDRTSREDDVCGHELYVCDRAIYLNTWSVTFAASNIPDTGRDSSFVPFLQTTSVRQCHISNEHLLLVHPPTPSHEPAATVI